MAYSRTRNQIIDAALKNVRMLASGQTTPADLTAECSRRLNDIIKSKELNRYQKMWKEVWLEQAITASNYVTNGGETYRCIKSHTSAAENEPGTGAKWRMYWYVQSTTGSTTAWALSTAYASAGEFTPPSNVIEVKKAFYRDESFVDNEMNIKTIHEYFDIFDKYYEGYPETLYFIETIPPTMKIYPQPQDTDFIINYLAVESFVDMDSAGDNPDFPDRWINALIWKLSAEISSMAGLSLNERIYLDNKAQKAVEIASTGMYDSASLGQFIPYLGG